MANSIQTDQFKYDWISASPRVPRNEQKLMIVLHGRGDKLNSFRVIKSELCLPQMNYLLLNAPRRYDTGFTWYAFPPNQKKGILVARERLMKLMSELEAQGWAAENIFFYGFSQGALISCDFAFHYERKLAGVIAISGYIYFFQKWKQKLSKAALQTPILMTHGIFDDALPIFETRKHVKKLKSAGMNILWKEFNKDHEIEHEYETPLIRSWVLSQINSKSLLRIPKRSRQAFERVLQQVTSGSKASIVARLSQRFGFGTK